MISIKSVRNIKYKDFDLLVREGDINFIGDYAIVKALVSRKKDRVYGAEIDSSPFYVIGVIDKEYKEAFDNEYLMFNDRYYISMLRAGSNDFIVYKTEINNSYTDKTECLHLRVIGGNVNILNKDIDGKIMPTILPNTWLGNKFLYNIEEAKIISPSYAKIDNFIRHNSNEQKYICAKVTDYVYTNNDKYELTFYIDVTNQILTPVFCKYNNTMYNQHLGYDVVKEVIIKDLMEEEAKRQITENTILKLRYKSTQK